MALSSTAAAATAAITLEESSDVEVLKWQQPALREEVEEGLGAQEGQRGHQRKQRQWKRSKSGELADKFQEASSSVCFIFACFFFPDGTPFYFILSVLYLCLASTAYHYTKHVYPNKQWFPHCEFADSLAISNLCAYLLTLSPFLAIGIVASLIWGGIRNKGKYLMYLMSLVRVTWLANLFYGFVYAVGLVVVVALSFVCFDTHGSLMPVQMPWRWNKWSVWGWHIGQGIFCWAVADTLVLVLNGN